MSIFEETDRHLSNKSKFWLPTTGLPLNEAHLHTGMLRLPSKQSGWVTKYFILTSTAFYCCSKTSKRARGYVHVNWKPFEPFSESDSGEELFGFKLGNEGNSQDFYASSEDELDMWVNSFRKVSILSGIHDDYDMGEKLGEGNYATVLRATDNETGSTVAIKCIPKEKLQRSSQGAKILVNEIDCMRRLDHPNILKIERVYEENEHVYIVLEYVEGGDLFAKIIAAEKFSERYSAVLARKMLTALVYMHEKNIIHRDLKLENIMMTSLDEEADIKIADFGFAAEMTTENMSVYCGSPGYVAPEILNKLGYDAKADVFSLGIIVYIILSGNSPFFGRSVEETLAKNREGRIRFEPSYWADISDDAKDFVMSVTERNSKQRTTAAEALRHRWIYANNRQYFDSLEVSLRRPSFSKRRPMIDLGVTAPKSAGLPKIKAGENSALSIPSGSPRSRQLMPPEPMSDLRSGFLTPGASSNSRDGTRMAISPGPNGKPHSGHTSPFTASLKSPTSAGLASGKRNITWKQIKPHP
mmetsp:Transcript_7785/g.14902  ORF Transcript_7785/g.14902 Transcript_7785/m.14902 type:complete len:527 (-) Transcript_7785:3970-5550(-)